MRLTCPNCNAQYEVDDAVIPRGGRDVQCSSCGHTWYQYPKDVALDMRAADLDDEDEDENDAGQPLARPAATRAAPRIDKTVLDVLREEAERELNERQRARGGLETQGDLGLARPTRPRPPEAATARAAPAEHADDEAPTPSAPPSRRRNLLPDIEELTSTLEPGSEERHETEAETLTPDAEARGFRRGLSVIMLIAAALVFTYLLAPLIAAWVPALHGPLASYVAAIDGLRAAVSGLLRGLIGV